MRKREIESMFKKSIILGLILLLSGATVLGWVLIDQRKEKQLLQEELEVLDVELVKLDKLLDGEVDINSFAKVFSLENWHQQLSKYKMKRERRGLVINTGVMCMLTGGAIFTWWILLWTVRFVIWSVPYLNQLSANVFRWWWQIKNKESAEAGAKRDDKASERNKKPRRQQSQLKKRSKALETSGWHSFDKNCADQQETAQLETDPLPENQLSPDRSSEDTEKIAVLYSDEESAEFEESLPHKTEELSSNTEQPDTLTRHIRKTASSAGHVNSLESEEVLKQQTDNLEKQVSEFRQMTKAVQQTAIEHSGPLNDSLKELTQQVAAIREYASQQQERVDKLQEGYDWNITRTFCLKVIRCIDNLENRIARLSERNINAPNLEEIRDELIFALESSGVERFEPQIKSGYRGQEKRAEAVKEREFCETLKLKGKIAKVLRLGYQYVIDEENVRVVRVAKVKLFG